MNISMNKKDKRRNLLKDWSKSFSWIECNFFSMFKHKSLSRIELKSFGRIEQKSKRSKKKQ